MLLVEELAELTGINVNSLKHFINNHPDKMLFFHKEPVQVEVYNPLVDKTYKYKRLRYVLDEDKIEAFKYYWAHGKNKRAKTNGLNGAGRLTWTETAIDCYNAKCICKKCNQRWTCAQIEKHTKKRLMKQMVLKIFAELGRPPERIIEG